MRLKPIQSLHREPPAPHQPAEQLGFAIRFFDWCRLARLHVRFVRDVGFNSAVHPALGYPKPTPERTDRIGVKPGRPERPLGTSTMPANLTDFRPRWPRFSEMSAPKAVAFVFGVFACVVAVTLLVSSFNSGRTSDVASDRPAENAVAAKPKQNTVAARPDSPEIPQPSRVVGAAHQKEGSCDDQTWPYIEQRCLTVAPPKERVVSNPPAGTAPSMSASSNAISSSRSTDGVASAADRITSTAEPTANPVNAALPDRPMAITGDPMLKPAEPIQDSSPKAEPSKPELSLPARNAWAKAIPADRAAASTTQTSEPAVSPRRKARPPRERTASARGGDPNRIVRRWREVEYQGFGGDTRKIIYVRPGTLQRDIYFETAR